MRDIISGASSVTDMATSKGLSTIVCVEPLGMYLTVELLSSSDGIKHVFLAGDGKGNRRKFKELKRWIERQ